VNIVALTVALVRREPMVVVPYIVYSLLTFLATTYLVPTPPVVTMATAFQLPWMLLAMLIFGDFLARGVTITLIATQFASAEFGSWRQWWRDYTILSLVFGLLYMGVGLLAMGGEGRMETLGVVGAVGLIVTVFVSVILILFSPFLMYFRGVGMLSSVMGTFGVIRYRLSLVFRVFLMNLAIVFLFVFFGAMVSPLPLIGVTLGYLFQALGQMVALIYSFVLIGSSEWKSGVLLDDDGPPLK